MDRHVPALHFIDQHGVSLCVSLQAVADTRHLDTTFYSLY